MKFSFLISALLFSASFAQASPTKIEIKHRTGKFDLMTSDPKNNRILAAHKAAGTLEVLSLDSHKVSTIEVGDAQGVAIDDETNRYFTGNDEKKTISVIDSLRLVKLTDIPMPGSVDAIAYDTENKMIYAAEDAGSKIWVVDPIKKVITATIEIPGAPELMEYDRGTKSIFVNIKNKNLVVRIHTGLKALDASWSTLPAISPHGLALDSAAGRIYVAGANATLVALDLKDGHEIFSTNIPEHVDQIAFDPNKNLIYTACKGALGIVKSSANKLTLQGTTPLPAGAHTLALAPQTGDVWITYGDTKSSFFEKIDLK